jgi:hypothetical protein
VVLADATTWHCLPACLDGWLGVRGGVGGRRRLRSSEMRVVVVGGDEDLVRTLVHLRFDVVGERARREGAAGVSPPPGAGRL